MTQDLDTLTLVSKPTDRRAATELYRTTRSLTETMIRLRPLFNNDLDQLLVFMVFLLDPLSQEACGRGPGGGRRGMNAFSISQITGIARESTRRKLHSLAQSGLITPGLDRLWQLGAGVGADELRTELQPLVEVLSQTRTHPAPVPEQRAA